MAKIGIVSQRLLGHILPIIGVGEELKKLGHEVWILAHKSRQEIIEKKGINYSEITWDKDPKIFLEENIEEILTISRNIKFEFILCDSSQAAPAYVAEILDIPWMSFQTTVPLSDSDVPGNKLVNKRLREQYLNKHNIVRGKFNLPKIQDFKRSRGDFAGLSPFLHLVMVTPLLVDNLEVYPSTFKLVGPCSYTIPSKTSVIAENKFMKNIVVCTSSSYEADFRDNVLKYLNCLIKTFNNNHNYKFTICDQRGYLNGRDLPSNFTVDKSYPSHESLMKNIDLVITHGGCGTLQQTMKQGIPMIVIPLGADHDILASKCEMLGISKTLPTNILSDATLQDMVESIISNPQYQVNSRKVSSQMKNINPNNKAAMFVNHFIKNYRSEIHEN
ncbi:glycosyltransferase [Cytobacillus praedii]|uniref:glycosyltransferase n=1 Tax=Cytobacillus praedii TaxID=1742358 RepID=UPI003F7E240B